MRYYKKIHYWENIQRVDMLNNFRNLVIDYFNNVQIGHISGVKINEDAANARILINKSINKVRLIILTSGINPTLKISPSYGYSGEKKTIDFNDIFIIHTYEIPPTHIIDFIDRSIGVYEEDELNSKLRTVNPFFWLGLVLEFIVNLPFKLIGELGFNQSKFEASSIGKVMKLFLQLITIIASFYTIYLGLIHFEFIT